MSMRPNAALAAITIALSVSAARADTSADQARALYEAGRVQYNLGDYVGAVREFAAGYKLMPRPEFLVNMGQAYRRLGELERAREMYVRYLSEAPADEYARAQVRKLIAEVDGALARSRNAPRGQSTETDDEPDAAAPATLTQTSLAPAATVRGRSQRDFWRRNWWIVPVSAVALTGLVVGIYFGTRPNGPDCSSASLGCLPAR